MKKSKPTPSKDDVTNLLNDLNKAVKPYLEKFSQIDLEIAFKDHLKKQVCQSNEMESVHYIYDFCRPEYDKKRLSFGACLNEANDEAVLKFIDFLDVLQGLIRNLRESEIIENEQIRRTVNGLEKYHANYTEHIMEEMYSRVQGYKNDINHLIQAEQPVQ